MLYICYIYMLYKYVIYNIYIYKKFLSAYIKMEKTTIKFGNIEIKKQTFQQHKIPISIKKYRY